MVRHLMANSDQITFAVEGGSTASARQHAIAPILIGLLAPVLVLLTIDPRALGSATVLLHIYLGAIFIIATIAYIISVFDGGQVTQITVLEDERALAVELTGLVAKKTIMVPFRDVASLRVETRYDDDGYRSDIPLIVLTTRQVIELPESLAEADLAAMRRFIGRS